MIAFERLFVFMSKPRNILGALLMVLIAYYWIDRSLAIWVFNHHFQEKLFFLKGLTLLGGHILVISILVAIALFFRYVKPKQLWEERAWFLSICVLVPNLIALVLKVFLGRARPDLFFQEGLYGFFGFQTQSVYWSCPSGHTTTIMALAFGLSILFPKRTFAFIIVALCIAATRIFLLKHFMSDVMTASFLALIEIGLIEWVIKRYQYFKLVQRIPVSANE